MTRWQFLARLLATVMLLGSAMLSVLFGVSLLMFGGAWYAGLGTCVGLLCLIAIWQAWKRPTFSALVWLMLALAISLATYFSATRLYQAVFLRDLTQPVPPYDINELLVPMLLATC